LVEGSTKQFASMKSELPVMGPARLKLAAFRAVHTDRFPMNRPTSIPSHSLDSPLNADRPRIAFVQACWHREIVDRSKEAFLTTMEQYGYTTDDIDFYVVPGAFEIPLHAKRLARGGRHAGIIAAALVVDGGIYRHEFVANAVVDGLMHVQLETDVPVFSLVLTPHKFHQGEEHIRFFKEHFLIKGAEVAHACADTIHKLGTLDAR
jgi:6,7-dimethyl-8-ribityllumazine synthase